MSHVNRDRQRGTILGLAIGDALGAPVEFEPHGAFEPIEDFRAGGPYALEAGQWTDDTSMALALADSISEVGWDLDDQARRYLAWRNGGAYSVNGTCFDIGITNSAALGRYRELGDARRSGEREAQTSGNGSIMRLGPVPAAFVRLFPDQRNRLVEHLVESSLTTHASPQCLSACAYMGLILAGLIHGLPRETVLDPEWEVLDHLMDHLDVHEEIAEVARGSYRRKQPPEIVGSGYVVKSLEAALWAFADAPDFATAVLRAVNLGDDADTTGAVCGQLAGACWGESGIPDHWLQRLDGRDKIDPILDRLFGPSEIFQSEA